MVVIIVLVVLAALVLPFVGGRITESNGTPSPTPAGSNGDTADCGTLCTQWDQRRQERCQAEAAAAAAQRNVEEIRAQWAVATAIAVGLAVAAALAANIPIVGYGIAIALGIAAAAAFIAADFLLGRLTVAGDALAAAERLAANRRDAEAQARTALVQTCGDKANACLSRPGPC